MVMRPEEREYGEVAKFDERFPAVPVADTAAATEPIVALGAGPLASFIAVAELESWANPTDGGLNRNTEYTFFWEVV